MAIDFNINPYYDDFDEAKNYHRILFRPGYAVQARELTQLQTQIQDQVSKFGKHIFVNGTVVLGGQRSFENNVLSIKMESTYLGVRVDPTLFKEKIIVGEDSETKAIVKVAEPSTPDDPLTFMVKVISGTDFIEGERIFTDDDDAYPAIIQATNAFFTGTIFNIDEGIFFVDGKFVYLEPQTISISKYTTDPTVNIGLVLNETVITADQDTELLDRAQGSPNFSAPGADRYFAGLTLTVKNPEDDVEGFLEISRLLDGVLVSNPVKTVYSEIGNELARRTFDESGDYTVRRWPIQILDHQSETPDETKFTVALDPGKGYIKGYEFETISQEFVDVDKARDTEYIEDQDLNVTFGNYINVTGIFSQFITNATTNPYSSVQLHNIAHTGTMTSTSKLGTAKVRFLRFSSGTPGSTAIYRMYLFDIVMDSGKFFKDLESIVILSGTTRLSGANVSVQSKIGATSGGDAFLSGQDAPGLVFPIGKSFIDTIRLRDNPEDPESTLTVSAEYSTQRTYAGLSFTGGTPNQVQIATNSDETFRGTAGSNVDTDNKNTHYHAVITAITNAGSTGLVAGDIINFSSGSRTIALSSPSGGAAQTATFTIDDSSFAATVTIIATISANEQIEKTKTLSVYKYAVLTTLPTTKGGKKSIGASDIYDVLTIQNTGNTNPTTHLSTNFNTATGAINWSGFGGTNTDVTNRYAIDNGQRDEYYDHGNIVLTGTPPSSTNYVVVVYRNFAHTGSGFLSRDSYSGSGIDYEDIPTFTSPTTGISYNLRDCLDFRPRRTDGATALTNGQVPDPQATFNADYSFYLGRMDRIIATTDNKFIVKKGVSELVPVVPTDESNGMTLYVLAIPPYTANLSEVQIRYIDNRRYTMRDIGRLEKRIQNLEYYTQLSLLEKQAKDTSIPDSSNKEKFKNGFAVDPFTSQDVFLANPEAWTQRRWGWWNAWFNGLNTFSAAAQNYNENSIADATNIDFNAAIDPINQELRAPFNVDFIEFNTGTFTNTSKAGDLVTLTYTEVDALDQLLATSALNVNPFDVIQFNGTITLNPAFDQWVDTVTLPDVNKIIDVAVPDAADRNVTVNTGSLASGNWQTTSTATTVTTNVIGSSVTSLGTSVVDVQYVPYMRAKTIIGIGKSFKPKSQLWPFIENSSISSYVKPLTIITIQNHTGTLFNSVEGQYESLSIRTTALNPATQTGTAKAATYSQPTTTDSTKRLLAVYDTSGTISVGSYVYGLTGTGYGLITAVTTYSLGNNLVPDEYGTIAFQFNMPGSTFRTGERTIRLIDNNINDLELQNSFGEAKYTATGIVQTQQETILTTRSIQRQRTTITTGRFNRPPDPLAQTFLVQNAAYPAGMHVSSIDIYFRKKSLTVPVTLQLRRSINGYPESAASLPFAEVTLRPEQVNIYGGGSATTNENITSTATTFRFPNPVHLVPGEYAIVILANTQDYEVYVAEMGGIVLGGTTKVSKQPHTGSLFKSQNAFTWEPDQNKDLKFRIRRAQFASSGSATFEIQDPGAIIDYHTLFANVSSILPTGTTINWAAKAYYGGSAFDTNWIPVNINRDINYGELRRLADAAGIGGTPSLQLRASLTTDNNAVSPAVDASTLSVITALNQINNDSTGEAGAAAGGNATAKYISKPINLADGFDATNLCVTVDIFKPPTTNVKVYYKTLPTEKTTDIRDENWTEMVLERTVSSSATEFDYKEHRFFPPGAFDSNDIPLDGPITARFNIFQVKIVLLSTNQASTPKLKDLRIIALDS